MTKPNGRVRLEPCEERPVFDCDNKDLNEYFHVDSIKACEELIAVTYVIYDEGNAVAYYCVSNDAIRSDLTSNTVFKRIRNKIVTPEKRYRSMPAVKIGRFAVRKDLQRSGIGSNLMAGIKFDFVTGNKTGCRFIIVDAYQTSINFYKKNGFDFLSGTDKDEETRLMYFDLIQFVNGEK